ncbi:hypothetical protein GUITHDRAFT_151172 [Guillardia theta CCMP2712]|uniref:Uncharacterized protein n=1 Tax=Guillardia theta (strain CCMP2712) TaxID=905079 RepID=L1JPV9_GUITC|nr:hypothetical protein GUITHDRAFT_151172 [Guillardia theta CCMP2712]EKX50497.1 hypothetical protein GUITHDRAFT_151172 [Guillardia theta CCMP2712]|eukprot:XP_005837477.1 hypothetical protein GUITHDRAFT_151172 [Guillardia theta CCMP2712]
MFISSTRGKRARQQRETRAKSRSQDPQKMPEKIRSRSRRSQEGPSPTCPSTTIARSRSERRTGVHLVCPADA